MTAQTTTQRTAKHRLAVKERMARLERQLALSAQLFAAAIEHMQEGYDWHGCDLQDTCIKIGLTKYRLYDPDTDSGMDASEGDMIWVPTTKGQEILLIAREALNPTTTPKTPE